MGVVAAVAILLVAVVLGVLQVELARRRRGAPGAFWVGALGALSAAWSLHYLLAILVGPTGIVALAATGFAVAASVPAAGLMAALCFRGLRPGRAVTAAVLAPSAAVALASLTNPLHHLFLRTILPTGDFRMMRYEPGVLYGPLLAGAYLALLVAIAVTASMVTGGAPDQRRLVPVMLAAYGLPTATSIAFNLRVVAPMGVDWTPVALAVAAALVGFCVLRLRLLDVLRTLVPAGRHATIQAMADGVIVLDARGRILDANPAAGTMAGRRPRDLVGLDAGRAFPSLPLPLPTRPGDGATFATMTGAAPLFLEVRAQALDASGGLARGTMVMLRDVTDRILAEDALRMSERRYRELVQHATDVVFTADPAGPVLSLNDAGQALFGPSPVTAGRLLGAGEGPVPAEVVAAMRTGGTATADVWVTTPAGRRTLLEVRARLTGDGAELRIEGIARDVTERRSWEAHLAWLALHDPLTRLPNRTMLHRRLDEAIAAAAGTATSVAVILVDLDHFKDVNDTLGHPAGDEVLVTVARRLEAAVEGAGTVGRLGGDEFAVVLPASPEEARRRAYALLAALEAPHLCGDRSFAIGASLGVAVAGHPDLRADTLLGRADRAMYSAKTDRAGVVVWAPSLSRRLPDRLGVRSSLLRAVDRDELALHYQPQVRLADGALTAVEALVRWHHPERGLLMPAEFVPLAEQYGAILEVTRWVVDRALTDSAAWREAGVALPVAVNISPLLLGHGRDLVAIIRRLTRRRRADPTWLKMEITESAAIADAHRGGYVLSRLAAAGVTLAIDDFGIGHSSLALLRSLPVVELKMDRSFVHRVCDDEGDEAIVRAIVSLARDLRLTVVAEGIEDERTRELLEGIGCDGGQGFHFGPPLTSTDLLDWIAAREGVGG